MHSSHAVGVAFFLVTLASSAPAQIVCVANGGAIIHTPPPPPPGLPGHSIAIAGTFTLTGQTPGACPNDPCTFTFDVDVVVTVAPATTPTQGELCLTLAAGAINLACGPTTIASGNGWYSARAHPWNPRCSG